MALFGMLVGIGAAVCVGGLMFAIARRAQAQRATLRATGTVQTAYIRHIHGYGVNLALTVEIALPSGSHGQAYAVGNRGYDMAWLTHVCATNTPIEILYAPGARTILVKHPTTGQFS